MIQSIDELRVVRARVTVINFQFPPVPANRCFGLQVLADAFYYVSQRQRETNLKQKAAKKLALRADARVIAYSEQLQSQHDQEFNRQLAEKAESEIARIVELEYSNFDKSDEWREANERGDEPAVSFAELDVSQLLEFQVADRQLLEHLVVGLTWETAMYARDETYDAFGHGRAPGYGRLDPNRRAPKAFSEAIQPIFSFGTEFSPPWPNYVEALGLGQADIPELLEIVATWDLSLTYSGFSAEECGPRHAWRALGQLHASSAVPSLLEALLYERNLEAMEYSVELPAVIGLLGPEAIGAVETFVARPDVDWSIKLVGLRGLIAITETDRSQHPAVERVVGSMLANYRNNSPYLNSMLINLMLKLDLVHPGLVKEVLEKKRCLAASLDRTAVDAFLKNHSSG